jgi:hypothetical protein
MKQNLLPQASGGLKGNTIDFLDQLCLLSASQHHDWVFPLALEM